MELGLPRQVFDFGPVVLKPEVVATFSNPGALTLCAQRQSPCTGAVLGSAFRALEHVGEWSRVQTIDGRNGWVHLPELGQSPNEIADFTGAMIAYYRGDFDQASRLFLAVSRTENASALIRQDAVLLKAASDLRLGRPADAALARIEEENPFIRYPLQLRAMAALSAIAKRPTEANRQALRALARKVSAKPDLFPSADPWTASFLGAASRYERP